MNNLERQEEIDELEAGYTPRELAGMVLDLTKRERKIKAEAFYEVGEKLRYEYEGAYNFSDIESFFDDCANKLEQGE